MNLDVAKIDGGTLAFHRIDDSVQSLHTLLGGYMEVVYIPEENPFDGLVMLADEDGLAKYTKLNLVADFLAERPIVGPVLIVRAKGSEFVSLTASDKAKLDWARLGFFDEHHTSP